MSDEYDTLDIIIGSASNCIITVKLEISYKNNNIGKQSLICYPINRFPFTNNELLLAGGPTSIRGPTYLSYFNNKIYFGLETKSNILDSYIGCYDVKNTKNGLILDNIQYAKCGGKCPVYIERYKNKYLLVANYGGKGSLSVMNIDFNKCPHKIRSVFGKRNIIPGTEVKINICRDNSIIKSIYNRADIIAIGGRKRNLSDYDLIHAQQNDRAMMSTQNSNNLNSNIPQFHQFKYYKNNIAFAVNIGEDKIYKILFQDKKIIKYEVAIDLKIINTKNNSSSTDDYSLVGPRHIDFHHKTNTLWVVCEKSPRLYCFRIKKKLELLYINGQTYIDVTNTKYIRHSKIEGICFGSEIKIYDDQIYISQSSTVLNDNKIIGYDITDMSDSGSDILIKSIWLDGLMTFGYFPRYFMIKKKILYVVNQWSQRNINMFKWLGNTHKTTDTSTNNDGCLCIFSLKSTKLGTPIETKLISYILLPNCTPTYIDVIDIEYNKKTEVCKLCETNFGFIMPKQTLYFYDDYINNNNNVIVNRDYGIYLKGVRAWNKINNNYNDNSILYYCKTRTNLSETIKKLYNKKLEYLNSNKGNNPIITVRGGGHSYINESVQGNSIIYTPEIGLSQQIHSASSYFLDRNSYYDYTNNRLTVSNSMRNGEIYRMLDIIDHMYGVNLDLPTGTCSTVGLSGFSLGGGHSIASSWIGFTCQYLHSVELCLPSGEIKCVDDKSDSDLMMVLRGGGQNLGVALSFTYSLPSKHYYNLLIYQRIVDTKKKMIHFLKSVESIIKQGYHEFTTLNVGGGKATIFAICPVYETKYAKNMSQLRNFFAKKFNKDSLYKEVLYRENICWSDIWMDDLDGLSLGAGGWNFRPDKEGSSYEFKRYWAGNLCRVPIFYWEKIQKLKFPEEFPEWIGIDNYNIYKHGVYRDKTLYDPQKDNNIKCSLQYFGVNQLEGDSICPSSSPVYKFYNCVRDKATYPNYPTTLYKKKFAYNCFSEKKVELLKKVKKRIDPKGLFYDVWDYSKYVHMENNPVWTEYSSIDNTDNTDNTDISD